LARGDAGRRLADAAAWEANWTKAERGALYDKSGFVFHPLKNAADGIGEWFAMCGHPHIGTDFVA
jgi:hypothetical protein